MLSGVQSHQALTIISDFSNTEVESLGGGPLIGSPNSEFLSIHNFGLGVCDNDPGLEHKQQ